MIFEETKPNLEIFLTSLKMTLSERLKLIQSQYDLKQKDLAEILGIKEGSMSDIMRGRAGLTKQNLEKLLQRFPEVSRAWLEAGYGEMLTSTKTEVSKNYSPSIITVDNVGNENILMVNSAARASYALEYTNPEYLQQLPAFALPSNKFRGGTFRCFEVKGESMSDTILPGSWVIARYVDDWYRLKDGLVYVVVMERDVVVKRVLNRIKDRAQLSLQSDNLDFDTYNVDVQDVREVWMVVSELRFQFKRSQLEYAQEVMKLKTELFELKDDLVRMINRKLS